MAQIMTLRVAYATANRIRRVADAAGLSMATTVARLLDELTGRREPEISMLLIQQEAD